MRALVLGGGGVTGIGWELGFLAGLAGRGLDLSRGAPADVVIGTSAGSVVGSRVASGVDLEAAFARQLVPPQGEVAAKLGAGLLLRFAWLALRSRTGAQFAARVGRLALSAPAVPEAERRAIIASRLPVKEWPERRLLISAVDAVTGETRIFDRHSGVELVDAVAASCAVPGVWPPVTIQGRKYIDGGIRSGTHLDLAAGCRAVLALVPIPRGLGHMPSAARQAELLQASGATVLTVSPDQDARRAIGRNVLDPAARAAATRAGRAQAERAAEQVRTLWESGGG